MHPFHATNRGPLARHRMWSCQPEGVRRQVLRAGFRNRKGILSSETVATALARACRKLLKAEVARCFESRVGGSDD